MEKISLNLFRSLRVENFPDGPVIDGQPAAALLHPDFEERPLPGGKVRKPDIKNELDKNGVRWVFAGGGTSLFDRANVFNGKGWLSFAIPDGTIIPPGLIIRNTGYNSRFDATHYQIECRMGTMRMTEFVAALDNLARNAIVRSIEIAKLNNA